MLQAKKATAGVSISDGVLGFWTSSEPLDWRHEQHWKARATARDPCRGFAMMCSVLRFDTSVEMGDINTQQATGEDRFIFIPPEQ